VLTTAVCPNTRAGAFRYRIIRYRIISVDRPMLVRTFPSRPTDVSVGDAGILRDGGVRTRSQGGRSVTSTYASPNGKTSSPDLAARTWANSRVTGPSAHLAGQEPAKTPGSPLATSERAFFGSVFSGDFSRVRVHTDDVSAASAARAGASAYTVGEDIFFAGGRYAPGTPAGQLLLAHELVHVVQQRRGAGTPGPAERAESEAEAASASRSAAAGQPVSVVESSPVGMACQPAKAGDPPTVPMYEYRNEAGAVVRVTEPEYQQLRAQATRQIASAITRVEGTADVWRQTHAEHMNEYHAESWGELWDKPQRLIGVAADIRAGVVPPPLSIWGHPRSAAEAARKAADAGDLVEAARQLRLAEAFLKDAKNEWNTYIEASISGGGKLVGELEIVRDVSFAIAVGAAVIVAAPVVAAGATAAATGIGLSGATAAIVGTGGGALGTGLVGVGTGTVLRGGSDAAAQKLATGKVDWHRTGAEVRKHVKEDFVTGVTAGLAPGVGKLYGAGTEGLSLTQNVLRQGAAGATTAGLANLGGTGADTAYALGVEGKSWQQAKTENLVPGLIQTGKATLAGGLGGAANALPGDAAQRLAAAGRPVLGQAIQHGGGALAAAGTTLATGGSGKDAAGAALNALVFSAAQPGARGRGPGTGTGTDEANRAAPGEQTATNPPAATPDETPPHETPPHETEATSPLSASPTVTPEPPAVQPGETAATTSSEHEPPALESTAGTKSARLRRGEPFSPDKRRPSLNQFKDVAPAAVDRHSGLRTNPDARIGVFQEPFPERVATPSGESRQDLGHSYERSLAEDLNPGDRPLRLRSTAGGKGRVTDVGVHEGTVEANLGSAKLDQLWSDLVERNEVMLTVPELTDVSARRLAHMAAVYEQFTGKRPNITVRETGPTGP